MPDLINIFPLLATILLGSVCAIFRFFNTQDTVVIVKLVFYLIIPALIFINLDGVKLATVFYWPYILTYLFSSLIIMVTIILISRYIFIHPPSETILNLMGATHTNSVYFALPLFTLLFHNVTPVLGIIIWQSLMTLIIVSSLELTCKKNLKFLPLLNAIFIKNPVIIAAFMGFTFSLFVIHVPSIVQRTITFIATPGDFLALFALGLSLITDNQKISRKSACDASIVIIAKTVFQPLVSFLLGRYFFNLNFSWLFALVIMSAMPSAKNVFIFAKKYQIKPYKYNWIVLLTTLLSIVIVISLTKIYF